MSGRIYCYAPQQRAVRTLLEPFMSVGSTTLVLVDEHRVMNLRGIQDGTFVMVTNHPERIPSRIHQELAILGFTLWHIDDSNARQRMGYKR